MTKTLSMFLALLSLGALSACGKEESTIAEPAIIERRAMSATDFVELPRITAPRLSADGSMLVYRRSEAIWEENKDVKRLRLVDLNAASTSSIIDPAEPDESFSSIVWAGAEAAFVTTLERDEDEFKQAYLYDIDSRALTRLTDHHDDVGDVVWSPNGDGFYFRSSAALADNVAMERDNGWSHEAYESGQNDEIWYYDRPSGDSRKLFGGAFHVRGYSLSRNGEKILYSRTDHTLGDRQDAELWLYDITEDRSRRITDNGFSEQSAELSPDGTRVAFIATVNAAGEHYYEDNVFVLSIDSQRAALILPDLAMEMLDLAWDQSGKGLFLLGNTGLRTQLYHYDLESRELLAITEGDSVVEDWEYSVTLDTHTFIRKSAENPGDVWQLTSTSTAPRRVTTEYAALAKVYRLPQQQVFQWQGRDSTPLEGLLVYPLNHRAGEAFPLVTITHGGPRSSAQFGSWNMSRYVPVLAGENYGVFLPNHRGGTGYGDEFMRDMVGGYFNNAHLDVLDGIDALIDAGFADPDRLIKMGWSAGGHMTNKLITVTDRFRVASSGAGAADWVSMYGESDVRFNRTFWFGTAPWDKGAEIENYLGQSMIKDAWRISTPSLFFVGENDERVPPTQAIMMYRGAREAGAETAMYVVPGEPHNYRKPKNRLFKINTELAWYARHLDRAPYAVSYPASKGSE